MTSRTKTIFELAEDYCRSGRANRDSLDNSRNWKEKPTRYKIMVLPKLLMSHNRVSEAAELTFNYAYLINIARLVPDQIVFYSETVRMVYGKHMSRVDMIVRARIIDDIISSLAMLNPRERGELYERISISLESTPKARFCIQLIVYCKYLLDERQTDNVAREHIVRSAHYLDAYSYRDSEDLLNIDNYEMEKILDICLPVVVEFDLLLCVKLSTALPKTSIILWCATNINSKTEKLASEIIERGRPSVRDLYSRFITPQRYELFSLMEILDTVILYERIGTLRSEDLRFFERRYLSLAANLEILKKDVMIWKNISLGREPGDVLLTSIFAAPVNQPGTDRTKRCLLHLLKEQQPEFFRDHYTYIESICLLGAELNILEGERDFLRSSPHWKAIGTFRRLHILALASAVDSEPLIGRSLAWLHEVKWHHKMISRFVLSPLAVFLMEPKKAAKRFEFKKRRPNNVYSLADAASNFLAGRPGTIDYLLSVKETKHSYSDRRRMTGRRSRRLKRDLKNIAKNRNLYFLKSLTYEMVISYSLPFELTYFQLPPKCVFKQDYHNARRIVRDTPPDELSVIRLRGMSGFSFWRPMLLLQAFYSFVLRPPSLVWRYVNLRYGELGILRRYTNSIRITRAVGWLLESKRRRENSEITSTCRRIKAEFGLNVKR